MPTRRDFLLASLALLGPASGRADAPAMDRIDALLAANTCRTRPDGIIRVTMTPHAPGELRYQGTHTLSRGAFRDLAAAYRGPRGYRVTVSGGDCDDGITTVRRGSADLGGLCCPVPGSRAEDMPWLLVARDYKAVVAHTDNPVASVSHEQLRAVARGKLTHWRELGGEDRAIALVVRKHCPDYFEPVRQLLLDNHPAWTPRGLFVERDEQIVDIVSRYRGGLGLVSWVFAKPLVEARKLKVLKVDGALPAQAATYPLTGPLSVVYRRWEADTMQPFFDFLYSPRGSAIIARTLAPVSAEAASYRPARWV